MGIVSFSHSPLLSILLAPAQALAAWFVPAQSRSGRYGAPARAQRAGGQLTLPFSSGAATALRETNPAGKAMPKRPTPSRLRIVREFDANVGPACAGRMVISGRMADVCAELDRMAQREAALQ
ncbi:hypothetical protein PMI15_03724 [Polaromonas sp. CF318]|uniref:hypothetical protein n=1 Tax=Polaromonas sp. CF318 TaxID=1144318 RepID=UPI000270F9F8|nr:hypothetical protein [Polaromonas sp. CF318]EJL80594.1 hypothetical protein PMI15_03724 [Polaromonas sp. CF318]